MTAAKPPGALLDVAGVAEKTRQYATDGQVLYAGGAASLLKKTEKAVYADVARRRIPFKKFGGRVIFLRSELERFLTNLPGCSAEEARANIALRSGEAVKQ